MPPVTLREVGTVDVGGVGKAHDPQRGTPAQRGRRGRCAGCRHHGGIAAGVGGVEVVLAPDSGQ